MKKKILLLGSNDRAALEAARSLGRRGLIINTVYFSNKELVDYSSFVNESFFLGNPFHNYSSFCKAFRDHVMKEEYQLIIPIDDVANEIVYHHRDYLQRYTSVAAPQAEEYEMAHNKIQTCRMCEELNIPYPKTYIAGSFDDELADNFTFPVFLKPQYSALLKDGFIYEFRVKKASSQAEMEDFLREITENCDVMVQQKVNGKGIGVDVAAVDGEILAYSVNKRLHEPPGGGSSSYRTTVPLNNTLYEYAHQIIRELNWTGIVMLEFKFDEKDYYLMEMNPRLWGSVGLSVFSGVDFPCLLYEIFTEGVVKKKTDYKTDYFTRNITRDIQWFIKEAHSKNLNLLLKEGYKGGKRILSRNEKIDEFDTKDMQTFFIAFYLLGKKVIQKIHDKFFSGFFINRKGVSEIRPDNKLLFLCMGNINRSAFAKEYLKQRYGVEATSAGTLAKRNRHTTRIAEKVAMEAFKIDLKEHRSETVFRIDLDLYDQIVVFDNQNYRFMIDTFPNHENKLAFLKESNQITDPYNTNKKEFLRIFSSIKEEIDRMVVT